MTTHYQASPSPEYTVGGLQLLPITNGPLTVFASRFASLLFLNPKHLGWKDGNLTMLQSGTGTPGCTRAGFVRDGTGNTYSVWRRVNASLPRTAFTY